MFKEKIAAIELAIANADVNQSKLTPEILQIQGMSTPKVRHLLNNLGTVFDDTHYLEIGIHKGSTFISANFQNDFKSSIAIDNYTQFIEPSPEVVEKEFLINCEKYLTNPYVFIKQDCFLIRPEQIPNPINFYLYDGCHDKEYQEHALVHYYTMLDDVFILVVDDWNWECVRNGINETIDHLKMKTLFKKEIIREDGQLADWHNGLFITLLHK